MTMRNELRGALSRFGAFSATLAGLMIVFFALIRPWYRSWGTNAALRRAELPGDHLLWQGYPRETRAIRVDAPADQVWPWVAQIGQDRGGFYSYELLEDLAGCEMTNLDFLIPSRQHWRPGDKLWMYPPHKASGLGQAPLALHEPGRALVFYTRRPGTLLTDPPDGTWAFIVEPIDSSTSQFIMRGRARGHVGLLGASFERSIFEPIHFAMERKMMEGVKARAEGRHVSKVADNVQLLLWTVTFISFLAAGIQLLRGGSLKRRSATFAAAGILFAFLTLVQPSLVLGIPLVIGMTIATFILVHATRIPIRVDSEG